MAHHLRGRCTGIVQKNLRELLPRAGAFRRKAEGGGASPSGARRQPPGGNASRPKDSPSVADSQEELREGTWPATSPRRSTSPSRRKDTLRRESKSWMVGMQPINADGLGGTVLMLAAEPGRPPKEHPPRRTNTLTLALHRAKADSRDSGLQGEDQG